MLYIKNLDDNNVMFGDEPDGGTHKQVYPKNLVARSDVAGRVWISDTDLKGNVLNNYPHDEITLDGVVYNSADVFARAFNALMGNATFTTTTTTAPVTTTTTTA